MPTIAQVSQAMQTVLSTVADHVARTTGFVQRTSKLTGAGFVQTLVFGFLTNPRATRAELAATASAVDVSITAQGLDQRMTEAGEDCLVSVLEHAAATVLTADPVTIPFTGRFFRMSPFMGKDVWSTSGIPGRIGVWIRINPSGTIPMICANA